MTQSPEQRDGNAAKPAKGEKSRLRDKTITFTLSVPKVFFGALFALFVLVWVFIFGIMLGRGHNPEEVVPELAKVMPTPAASQPSPAPADEVLQSRDLKYHDSLKGKNAAQPPRAVSPVVTPKQPAQPAAQPGNQQKPATAPKPVEQPKPAPQTPQPKPQTVSAPDQDQTVYNYVYQVAAVNDKKQAQTLQQKLLNSGIAAKVTETQANNKTWFRILVNFKGRPEDTRKLREKLAAHKITDIILRGKAPAN